MSDERPEKITPIRKRAGRTGAPTRQDSPKTRSREAEFDLRDYRMVLRVWQSPSFRPYASWVLLQNDSNGKMRVQRADWWRGLRTESFDWPAEEPPSRAIPREEVEPLLLALNEAHLPLTGIEWVMGLDGCKYGIETLMSFSTISIEWWERGPKEWRDFIDAATRLRELFRRYTQDDIVIS